MKLIGIVAKDSFDLESFQIYIRKFFNFPRVWFWLYLNVGYSCIADFKFGGKSILLPLFSMRGPPLFNENLEDWRCKLRVIQ